MLVTILQYINPHELGHKCQDMTLSEDISDIYHTRAYNSVTMEPATLEVYVN